MSQDSDIEEFGYFSDQLTKWSLNVERACESKKEIFRETRDVDLWFETFKKVAMEAVGGDMNLRTIMKKMLNINHLTELNRFGLKADNIVLYNASRERITDERYIIRELGKVAVPVYTALMSNNGKDVLKAAMGNLGGITCQVFKELQQLWEKCPPKNQLDLPTPHMLYLLNKGKYNQNIPSVSVRRMDHYISGMWFDEFVNQYDEDLDFRLIWLKIEEMVKEFKEANERQKVAWIYDIGFKKIREFIPDERLRDFAYIKTRFINNLVNTEGKVDFAALLDSFDGVLKKKSNINEYRTYGVEDKFCPAAGVRKPKNKRRKRYSYR